MYADVSVSMANFGIRYANWVNGYNNVLPNDGGCGVLDWNAHYNYVAKNGYGNASELVKNRMMYLLNIPRDAYSAMYAEVSVLIARYGVGGVGNIPVTGGLGTQTTTTTTTTTNPSNVNINMNLGGMGMNVNISEPNIQQSQTVTQQTTTTTTTIVDSDLPPPAPVAVMQGPCMLPQGDFSQIESAIKSKPFPETKMSTAQIAMKGKCLSINQIRTLAMLFAFPEDRLNFLKFAYDHTNDFSNYYTLSNTLTFDSDVENFNSFISTK
jgi:hypothetical protein